MNVNFTPNNSTSFGMAFTLKNDKAVVAISNALHKKPAVQEKFMKDIAPTLIKSKSDIIVDGYNVTVKNDRAGLKFDVLDGFENLHPETDGANMIVHTRNQNSREGIQYITFDNRPDYYNKRQEWANQDGVILRLDIAKELSKKLDGLMADDIIGKYKDQAAIDEIAQTLQDYKSWNA